VNEESSNFATPERQFLDKHNWSRTVKNWSCMTWSALFIPVGAAADLPASHRVRRSDALDGILAGRLLCLEIQEK
jgi:hypothetical protein